MTTRTAIYILCIDTTTDICSVSLAQNGIVVANSEHQQPNQHAALLTTQIQALLNIEQLTFKQLLAVAVSSGPGSYTGVRIGASVAKGLCYALGIPLISTDTLNALAHQAAQHYSLPNAYYAPLIDARRNEVFAALLDTQLHTIAPPHALILQADTFAGLLDERAVVFCGTGSVKCRQILSPHPNAHYAATNLVYCSAANLATLSYQQYLEQQFADTAYYEPQYVKPFFVGN